MGNKINKLAILGAVSLLSIQAVAATSPETTGSAGSTTLNTDIQKLSYTIGYEMGANFKSQSISVDSTTLTKGLTDGLGGNKPLLDKSARRNTIIAFQKEVMAKQQAAMKKIASQNSQSGAAFLATNAKKPGVKTLPDGLQYKILKASTGAKPTLDDTVTVNYQGSFVNGKVFDSSYKRGTPTSFPLTQVIKGWQEALTMMPTGSTWEIYVPAKLAYGERGMGRVIAPNATLVFKIELISIKKKSS